MSPLVTWIQLLVPDARADNWFFLPEAASTVAEEVDYIFNFINVVNLVFFVVMMGAVMYFAVAYRERGDGRKTSPVKGSHQLEFAWSVLPSFLLVAMFYMGFTTWMDMSVPPADSMEVRVQGQKWSWNFTTVDEESGEAFLSNDLVVPVNTPVQLTMTSTDVLHSFYVPAFRVKKDVVPNRYTVLWFEAIKTGDFQIYCTEYCGTDHSRMLSMVKVLEQKDYDAWIEAKIAEAEAIGSMSPAERGEVNFKGQFACVSCHSTDGSKGVGPTLKGIYGTEETLEDGSTVTVDDNYIRESLMSPAAKVVAGFAPTMPPFTGRVSDEQLEELILYIKSLK